MRRPGSEARGSNEWQLLAPQLGARTPFAAVVFTDVMLFCHRSRIAPSTSGAAA